MDKVMIVVGTRPEIVKMAPVIRAFKKLGLPMIFVNCGQHYDYELSEVFIRDLELDQPDYGFRVKSPYQGIQTARIITYMEKLLRQTSPSIVLVEGDTNTVLGTSIAAVKLGVPIGHVEAGLRSFDLRMPEEHNRRLTDHVSTLLFAPTEIARSNLVRENVWGKIHVTGNTVIDAVAQHLPIAEKKSGIMDKVRFGKFALVTAHRAENVDDPNVLQALMETFAEASVPIIFPMHPRTKKRLRQNGILAKMKSSRNIQVMEPLGYLDFLVLMKNCSLIVTDSGGMQEEATAPSIRKPTLVVRISTERPEAVSAGFAKVVGTNKPRILKAIDEALDQRNRLPNISPYGDGNAAHRIAEITKKNMTYSLPK